MFGFGKKEKKTFKIHIQNVRLPPMDILDEGDAVVVYLERGDKHVVSTQEKSVSYLRSGGDMNANFDEDLEVPITMQRQLNGDYKEKLCEISIRKRKKGLAGRKPGIEAFRSIAWTTIDVRKYIDSDSKGFEQIISQQMSWLDDGNEVLGKGAVLNGVVSVEEIDEDEEDETPTKLAGKDKVKGKPPVVPSPPLETDKKNVNSKYSTTTSSTVAKSSNTRIADKSPFDEDNDQNDDEEEPPTNARPITTKATTSASIISDKSAASREKDKPIHKNAFFIKDGDDDNEDNNKISNEKNDGEDGDEDYVAWAKAEEEKMKASSRASQPGPQKAQTSPAMKVGSSVTGSRVESLPSSISVSSKIDKFSTAPAPTFLSEFKERHYDPEDLTNSRAPSGATSVELSIRKQLEQARLENVNLREAVLNYEMAQFKMNFFADEVGRLTDLAQAEEAEMDFLRQTKAETAASKQAKIEENKYLAEELLNARSAKNDMQIKVADAKRELERLKAIQRDRETKRRIADTQKRKEEEAKNKGFFSW